MESGRSPKQINHIAHESNGDHKALTRFELESSDSYAAKLQGNSSFRSANTVREGVRNMILLL